MEEIEWKVTEMKGSEWKVTDMKGSEWKVTDMKGSEWKVTLCWVRAHAGIMRNELVDG